MLRVVGCIMQDHDPRLVALAACICAMASFTTVNLLARPQRTRHGSAWPWLPLAAGVFGCGVWSLHFIAMLAFMPAIPIAYDLGTTVLSIVVASFGAAAAFLLRRLLAPAAAGAIASGLVLGLAVSAMHYCGVAAMRLPGRLFFDRDLVAASVIVCIAFSIIAMARSADLTTYWRRTEVSAWLGLAICGMHFTAMAALTIEPGPGGSPDGAIVGSGTLAVAVGSVTLAILLVSLAATVMEQHLAHRSEIERQRMQLSDLSREALIIHDGTTILQANTASGRLFGRPVAELVGCDVLGLIAAADRLTVAGCASGRSEEIQVLGADGRPIPVALSRGAINFEGRPARVLGLYDLSDHKRHEARVRAVEADSRAKSAFLATMSHEIRTPLNAVLGLAGSLLDDRLTAEQRRVVRAIRDSGGQLLRALNDVLDYARLDAGVLALERASFSPAALMQEVAALYGPVAAGKGLALEVHGVEALPLGVFGDAERIGQVLRSLVANAVKFTSSGGVTFRAAGFEAAAGQAGIEWTVSDTGIGIAREYHGGLFDAFVQGDTAVARRFGGSGLGLAICRLLVQRMGGTITVESVPGAGSTFRVRLSLELAEVRAPPAAPPSVPLPEASPVREDPLPDRLHSLGRRLRLLLAEDNPTNRFVITRMLKDLPVTVDVAENGREAVDLALQTAYDLICMDVNMPETDGLEATRLIRQGIGMSRMSPIVAMTANVGAEDVQACRDAGMNDVVAKPVDKRSLLAAVLQAVTAPARVD